MGRVGVFLSVICSLSGSGHEANFARCGPVRIFGEGTRVPMKRQPGETSLVANKVQKDEQLITALTKSGPSP